MIMKIKYIALCGFLGLAMATGSQASCNAPDGTIFTIASATISGPIKAYVGMPKATYTCTIETDPFGYEDELTVTWAGDCVDGKVQFFTESSKTVKATVLGMDCSKVCDPLTVDVGTIKYFEITRPGNGAPVNTEASVPVKAVAPLSYSELYSVDVEWDCSSGGSGTGFSTAIDINHSHGYSVVISAIASRSTDVVAKMVTVTTLNDGFLTEYNRLLAIKKGWQDEINTAQKEITTKTVEQLVEEDKAEQLRVEKEAILDGMRIAEGKTAQFEKTTTNVGYTSTGLTLVKIVGHIAFPELGTINLTITVVQSLVESAALGLADDIYAQAVNDYPPLLADKNTAISTADAKVLSIRQKIIQLNSSIVTFDEYINTVNVQLDQLPVKIN